MRVSDIKATLLSGENLTNEAANWYTLCKPSANRFIICINGKHRFYKSLDSVSIRIFQLLKRGC